MSLFWGVVPICERDAAGVGTAAIVFQNDFRLECLELVATGDLVVLVADNELLPGMHDSIVVTRIS